MYNKHTAIHEDQRAAHTPSPGDKTSLWLMNTWLYGLTVFRALAHFGVLSEELEKLGGARTFGAFLLKILPLVTKITGNTEDTVPFTS